MCKFTSSACIKYRGLTSPVGVRVIIGPQYHGLTVQGDYIRWSCGWALVSQRPVSQLADVARRRFLPFLRPLAPSQGLHFAAFNGMVKSQNQWKIFERDTINQSKVSLKCCSQSGVPAEGAACRLFRSTSQSFLLGSVKFAVTTVLTVIGHVCIKCLRFRTIEIYTFEVHSFKMSDG